ncbi:MAG: phage portal protein [Gemmataceae bacterium]
MKPLLPRLANLLKAVRQHGLRTRNSTPSTSPSASALFASPFAPAAGWWRDDTTEQLRSYTSWVYAAVNAIAQEVARHRPIAFIHTGPADHDQTALAHSHPLSRLLARPNPWLTSWELWYLTTVHLELTGNCFWYLLRTPTLHEIWVIPTPWVKVIPDATEYVREYQVTAPGMPTESFAPSDVIHLKYPHPLDPHYGLSPLQAIALTVDANTELMKARYQTFKAGPRPGIVLQTPQMLSDPTVRRLEETLRERFSGRDNWHRPLVLEQGLAASPWTLTPAEMDFLNTGRMTRDEIFALFRVPLPVVGIIENVGLASDIWSGARAMFCEGTVQPKLELIGQTLTRDLAAHYDRDLVVSFPDCSPRTLDRQRQHDESDAKLGLRTVNEIRRGRGLAPYTDSRFDLPSVFPASSSP